MYKLRGIVGIILMYLFIVVFELFLDHLNEIKKCIANIVFQAVNQLKWKAGGFLCKFYAFLNHGTIAFHGFVLVFLSFFLYFWYRNPETFTQEGQTNVRKTK